MLFTYRKREKERRKVKRLAPESEPGVDGRCLPRASSEVVRQPSFQCERSVFLQLTALRGISQCAVEKHTSEM